MYLPPNLGKEVSNMLKTSSISQHHSLLVSHPSCNHHAKLGLYYLSRSLFLSFYLEIPAGLHAVVKK